MLHGTMPGSGGFLGGGGRSYGVMPLEARAPHDPGVAGRGVWAVVFAGGIGSRFWPLATPATPKPVLALVGGRPLVRESVDRLDPLVPADRVLVVTSADIAEVVRAALPTVPRENVLVEPRPLGTAAALAWGCHEVTRRAGPLAPVCAMHADLAAAFPALLQQTVSEAADASTRERALVTVGIRPTRVEPSFGHIEPGDALDGGDVADVARFVEKPGPEAAAALVGDGALWHSGIVVGAAQEFLDALRLYTPEVSGGLATLAKGDVAAFGETTSARGPACGGAGTSTTTATARWALRISSTRRGTSCTRTAARW